MSLAATENGRYEVLVAITASLKSAFSNVNLRVGLNEDQIIELADQIIDQSNEDNLALEDVLLFLQKFLTGSYGKIYDRMDIPTFFEFFEKYRQERYESLLNIRDEQHSQRKIEGKGREIRKDQNADSQTILDLFSTIYGSNDTD